MWGEGTQQGMGMAPQLTPNPQQRAQMQQQRMMGAHPQGQPQQGGDLLGNLADRLVSGRSVCAMPARARSARSQRGLLGKHSFLSRSRLPPASVASLSAPCSKTLLDRISEHGSA